MSEQIPSQSEKFPTEGEVVAVLEDLLDGREYIEVKRIQDEVGLYRLDFEVCVEGGKVVYGYQRDDSSEGLNSAIDKTFFDDEGMPRTAETMCLFKDGKFVSDNRESEFFYNI